ncbi:hypothetical protein ACWIGW_39615 [Nocardia brasiliensis]
MTKLPLVLPGLAVGLPEIVIGGAVASAAASVIEGRVSFSGLLRLDGDDWTDLGVAAASGGISTLGLGLLGKAYAGWRAESRLQRFPKEQTREDIKELQRHGLVGAARIGGYIGFLGYKIYDEMTDAVPTVDVSADRMLSGLPSEFLMPCPPRLSPAVEGEYRRAPQVVVDCFGGFVADAEAGVPEVAAPVVAGSAADSGIATYELARAGLAGDQAELSRSERRVPGLVEQGADIAARGKQAISDAVVWLNRMASTAPPEGRSQDDWSLEYLHAMLGRVQEAVGNTTDGLAGIGARIADLSPSEAGAV